MRARDQTQAMLAWWQRAEVDRADLAIRRASGAMIWHRDLGFDHLPLPWMRAENVRGAEVYIRPARSSEWPLVFLDDVDVRRALAVAGKYAALVVQTSAAGGCHLWLACTCNLDEYQRAATQGWLATRIDADPASISGEHLGRLAGFRNWKRRGVWVNVLDVSTASRRWDPAPALRSEDAVASPRRRRTPLAAITPAPDTSPSGREWAWVCSLLEAGGDPADVQRRLVEYASPRRGPDAERYARRTVERALRRSCYRSAMTLPRPDAR